MGVRLTVSTHYHFKFSILSSTNLSSHNNLVITVTVRQVSLFRR